MGEAKRDLVGAWMAKARADLTSARKLAAPPEAQLETAIYHCQQAAEKALKAFLVFLDHELIKTHDLGELVSECVKSDKSFLDYLDDAEELTPYATRFRYPGPATAAEQEEYDRAIFIAQRIFDLVEAKLKPAQ